MRKLILKMSMSLDGFVGGPNGELDWLFAIQDEAATAWTVAQISDASVHLMGSRTFHDMATWWPYSTEPYAPPMNDIPKLTFTRKGDIGAAGSNTSQAVADATASARAEGRPLNPDAERLAAEWAATPVITGDLATEIRRLKLEDGKPMVAHGGAGFARSLIGAGLVDEFKLLVFPVAVGRGLPIFSDLPGPTRLQLIDQSRFPSGATANILHPAT